VVVTYNKTVGVIGALALLTVAQASRAADLEGCSSCHRYRGLARIDETTNELHLFYVDPNYHNRDLGPHARLKCTDCHPRGEVNVVPHKPATPVRCTDLCHLTGGANLEVTFTHASIATSLASSVHSDKVLTESNRLLREPLRPGQAECLLCHDEPVFRWGDHTWADQEAQIARCDVCHTQDLPKDTRYYYWHVLARTRPALDPRDLVRRCAICHNDAMIRKHYGLPDSVASYLSSFHGKAMLLGATNTAVCLNCHTTELQNVHLMESHTQPGAPTSPGQIANTCRTPLCHPDAGQEISSAAIHLDLGTSSGVEYFIGALFFVLIVSTFGPSVLLQALELLQILLGRNDPRHERRRALAEQLAADSKGLQLLKRFTVHQRVQHWVLFASFATLVLTGFPLKFAERAWAATLVAMLGGLSVTRVVHHTAGAILLLGFAYHTGYVLLFVRRERRQTGKPLLWVLTHLPMVMNRADFRELWHLIAFLLGLRRERPAAGRFSLEEKFEYFGVFWGCFVLGVSGILMWANVCTTRHFPGQLLTIAALVHTFEAFLALLHVGIIHLVGVLLMPSVFPLSRAMLTGNTPPEELAEAHAGMLTEVAAEIGHPAGKEAAHD
jgi:formate dehydrogenase gamma subunit